MFEALYDPFMVIGGLVYYCYTNITRITNQFNPIRRCPGSPAPSVFVLASALEKPGQEKPQLRVPVINVNKIMSSLCLHNVNTVKWL